MKKWDVWGIVPATKFLGTFEAETKEEAIEKGLDSENNSFGLCHQCSNEIELNEVSCEEGRAEELL